MPSLNKPIQVVLLGSGDAGVPSLSVLEHDPYQLAAVITGPDRPGGRGQRLHPTPLKGYALAGGFKVLESASSADLLSLIEPLSPDALVVIDFRQIIPRAVFDRWPTLNLHFSLLPKYRGPSPVETAILDDASETGVSLIQIDAEIDHGPVISERSLPITRQTATQLRVELTHLGAELLGTSLTKFLSGELKPRPQDHSQATSTRKFTKADGRIDWSRPATELDRQIRALGIRPGTFTTWIDQTLKIIEAEPTEVSNLKSGQVSTTEPVVGTGSGALRLITLQLEGRRAMNTTDFLRGHPDLLGAQLGD